MLAPAYDHKDNLSEVWVQYSTHPDFKFWNAEPTYHFTPDIYPTQKKEEWVSVDDSGKIHGYFCAWVDKNTFCLNDIGIVRFVEGKRFSLDFCRYIASIRKRYRLARWACIEGNPASASYDHMVKLLGGKKVGTFTNKVRLSDGQFYNETWYEAPGVVPLKNYFNAKKQADRQG